MGCSPYGLARLFDEYPDVYEAYRAIALHRLIGEDGKGGGFKQRREATRAKRLADMARRSRR